MVRIPEPPRDKVGPYTQFVPLGLRNHLSDPLVYIVAEAMFWNNKHYMIWNLQELAWLW